MDGPKEKGRYINYKKGKHLKLKTVARSQASLEYGQCKVGSTAAYVLDRLWSKN